MSDFKTGDRVRAIEGTVIHKALGYRSDVVGEVREERESYVDFGGFFETPLKNITDQIEKVTNVQKI